MKTFDLAIRANSIVLAITSGVAFAEDQKLGEPQVIRSNDDYPSQEVKSATTPALLLNLQVDAKGRPRSCTAVRSSGSVKLDELSCKQAMRLRFKSAPELAGADATREIELPVNWTR